MYVFRNALLSITRSKGRNVLIGLIITIVTAASCIAFAINASSDTLIEHHIGSNPVEVYFQLDNGMLRQLTQEERSLIAPMGIAEIKALGESDLVQGYFYSNEIMMESDALDPVSYEADASGDSTMGNGGNIRLPNMQAGMGSFRLTGVSDPYTIQDFLNGTRQIISGTVYNTEDGAMDCIISEDLAYANGIEVGDVLSLFHPDNDQVAYLFTVAGIFLDRSDTQANAFARMNIMNPGNQIYTSYDHVERISGDSIAEAGEAMEASNPIGAIRSLAQGTSARYYLVSGEDVGAFYQEARQKGLSEYYVLLTNEEQIQQTIRPVQNLKDFSVTFLILVLLIGALVLGILNMINIRERKYEVGVMRAIGMSKSKVALQLVSELLLVALVALIIGAFIGGMVAQPLATSMLEKEINAQQVEQMGQLQNFGQGMGQGRMGIPVLRGQGVDYIDQIQVSIDFPVILLLIIVGLGLTLVSSVASVMQIAKYEPVKILRDRS
ncbi:MAG: FtsX-like permease family protein [Clostridia bacterium]